MFGTDKAFDVEHALLMYAEDYVLLPAEAMYNKAALAELMDRISLCHIYMIGFVPKIDFLEATQIDRDLICHLNVRQSPQTVSFKIPEGLELLNDDGHWYLGDTFGNRYFPNENDVQIKLHQQTGVNFFNVQYVGQSFGNDGSRNALDRLIKHETLQKISIKGTPNDERIQLLLLKLQTRNSTITIFNPRAKDMTQGTQRIKNGVNKLYGTSENERITLFEASLIRYFEPKFNKEFKGSFPSTNLKVLKDCYEKDFAAVIAEICFDDFPFGFVSEKAEQKDTVMAAFHLHEEEDRKAFFSIS